MRLFLLAFAVAFVLPAAASAAEPGQCEYRNPGNPGWNFLSPCTVTVEETTGRTTVRADVSNGSTFTVVEEGVDGALRFTVNGLSATRLSGGASRCYLTDADTETICIHAAGADVAAPPATAAAPDNGIPAIDSVSFGGGEDGDCLVWVASARREGLIEHGACARREDCAVAEDTGTLGCIIDIAWKSGRSTAMTQVGDEITLDGALATPGDNGCFTDTGAGLHFCFSKTKMTAEVYPALALPPAPDPEPLVVAAPVAVAPAPAAPVPAAPAPVAEPIAGTCGFLRGEMEVSSWGCTETSACEAPLCTVTYTLDNDTTVTLDAADGKVVLMNGAKADPVAWQAGQALDVTRPGAPYTFRFTPDGAQ